MEPKRVQWLIIKYRGPFAWVQALHAINVYWEGRSDAERAAAYVTDLTQDSGIEHQLVRQLAGPQQYLASDT